MSVSALALVVAVGSLSLPLQSSSSCIHYPNVDTHLCHLCSRGGAAFGVGVGSELVLMLTLR
jgi:hypothetical protein